ncbi:MAG: hypothetical protein JSU79_09400 [Dehalococcoidales bacterium]|nr:MAG: hypothetical protein JSU79_09400 [Dehalococcoidales bacterium]
MSVKTVFILGSGASQEARLSTGVELKNKIAQLLDIRFEDLTRQISGDQVIGKAFSEYLRQQGEGQIDINPYLHEAWHIRDALPLAISIDQFIDTQRNNEKIAFCAKLAIVRSILMDERDSLLYYDFPEVNLNFRNIEDTWYNSFFKIITENCSVDEIPERLQSIALIVFNYDRCVEHFLYNSLRNFYKLDSSKPAELMAHLKIYHPYGVVGTLPWLDREMAMGFGAEPNTTQLLALSKGIKTFTEGSDPKESEILTIKDCIRHASTIVFLGFAYHQLNMRLITPEEIDDGIGTRECYATTLGISENDSGVIEDQVKRMFNRNITVHMSNKTCFQLFTCYWRSVSSALNYV